MTSYCLGSKHLFPDFVRRMLARQELLSSIPLSPLLTRGVCSCCNVHVENALFGGRIEQMDLETLKLGDECDASSVYWTLMWSRELELLLTLLPHSHKLLKLPICFSSIDTFDMYLTRLLRADSIQWRPRYQSLQPCLGLSSGRIWFVAMGGCGIRYRLL